MWIIPKTLSAFVQDTEGLNLELDEQAWMLEQSAMWRSKPSSKQTFLRRLKKGGWITPLSTRILKPSQQESFEEKFTESLVDIPVSRSVARGSEKEKKTQGTCGPISESMSGQLDLFGAFSRMSEATPRWGYGESCPIWKKMVTERSGACSVRRKQARLTNASECSSWPTVAASEARLGYQDRSRGKKGSQKSLTTIVVDNWSTPQARDWKGAQGRAYKGEAKDLPAQTEKPNWPTASASDTEGGTQADRVEWTQKGATLRKKNKPHMTYGAKLRDAVESHEKLNWATPNTMDHLQAGISGSFKESLTGRRKRSSNLREQVNPNWPTPRAGNPGSRKPGTGGKILAEEAKIHAGPPAQEKSSTSGKSQGSPKLNPNWVEQLMGLPVGWTQLPTEWTDYDSSATALSPKPQN
jgi:hypothetical protein